MDPTPLEIKAGRIKLLLKELRTGKPVDPSAFADAFIYDVDTAEVDAMTAKLCEKLQGDTKIGSRSLELQIWWRDHQESDRKRLQKRLQARRDKASWEAAIAKLTPHERKLLGLSESEG